MDLGTAFTSQTKPNNKASGGGEPVDCEIGQRESNIWKAMVVHGWGSFC